MDRSERSISSKCLIRLILLEYKTTPTSTKCHQEPPSRLAVQLIVKTNAIRILFSVKYTSDIMAFKWRERDPVTLNPDLKLLQFALKMTKNYGSNTSMSLMGGKSLYYNVKMSFYKILTHWLIRFICLRGKC